MKRAKITKSVQAGVWTIAVVIAGFLIFSFVRSYMGAGAFSVPEGRVEDAVDIGSCPAGQTLQTVETWVIWPFWSETSYECVDASTPAVIEPMGGTCSSTGQLAPKCGGTCPEGQSCKFVTSNVDDEGVCKCT